MNRVTRAGSKPTGPWRHRLARVALVPVAALVAVCLPAAPASAATLTVMACDASSDADETHLRQLFAAANDESVNPGPDTVQLSAGCVYTFTTTAASDVRDALPAVDTTITLEGNGATIQGVTFNGDDVDHLLRVTDTGNLTVRDLIMRDGHDSVLFGGAAIHSSGSLTIERSTFLDNVGGAVTGGGLMTVRDSVFRGNRAPNYYGAAIRAFTSLIVDNTLFKDNFATGVASTPRNAGAVYVGTNAGAFISDSVFEHNQAHDNGGAILNAGSLAVTNSTFTQNSAGLFGGAIMSPADSSLTVSRSYFGNNHSTHWGGAIHASGTASISNSTFYANGASDRGGAVSTGSASANIASSTFASNVSDAHEGEAVFQGGTLGVTKNSVFAGHTSACYTLHDGGGNIVDQYDPSCSGGFFLGDPALQAPALNGGTTRTMRLGAGSKAMDRIASGCPTTDQRGFTRPSGPKCDIGAYEDQVPTAPGMPAVTSGSNPSRTGALTLSWAASTDPDGPATYRLLQKDADDVDYGVVGTTTSTSYALTEPEATYSFVVEAFDDNHTVPSSALTGVVVDKNGPATPTVTPDRAPDYVPAAGASWYLDTVTVTTTANGDPALADGSTGSGVASVTAPATYSTSGTFPHTGAVTDAAGNASLPSTTTVNVDAEAPSVVFTSCPSSVLLKHYVSAGWTASDPSSGLTTAASGTFTLDTATIGHKSVSTTGGDHVGHTTTATCEYDVIYDFAGFFSPLVNPPAVYSASAGRNVAVSFSLAGNQGLGVIAAGYPQSTETPCDAFGAQTTGTATTAVKPGLTFSSGSGGRYTYLWKTSTSMRGTCRQFVVKLNDGTYHRANLAFG